MATLSALPLEGETDPRGTSVWNRQLAAPMNDWLVRVYAERWHCFFAHRLCDVLVGQPVFITDRVIGTAVEGLTVTIGAGIIAIPIGLLLPGI